MDHPALWEALGRPRLTALLPFGRSAQWRAMRARIGEAYSLPACSLLSPTGLWRAIHGCAPPRGATWEALLHGGRSDALLDLCPGPAGGGGIRLASWNARWLVDLGSEVVVQKKAMIARQLRAGRLVLLQETHWDDTTAAIWTGGVFPHCRVAAAPACAGPGGGPQGGVAILCPAPFQCGEARILHPGCAVAVDVVAPGRDPITIVSVYLPPGRQEDTAIALTRHPRPGVQVIVGGDLNLDLGGARNQSEAGAHAALAGLMRAWDLQPLHEPVPTRRGAGGEARLDYLLGTTGCGNDWRVSAEWHSSLSDHAVLTGSRPSDRGGQGRTCTPEALRTLPAEAWQDLRRLVAGIEARLDVPPGPQEQHHPTASCHSPTERDAAADAFGLMDDAWQGQAPPAPQWHGREKDNPIPRCPLVQCWGAGMFESAFAAWWRNATPGRSEIADELARIGRSGAPVIPSERLRDCLQHVGCEEDDVDPAAAQRWLGTWRQLQRHRAPDRRGTGAGRRGGGLVHVRRPGAPCSARNGRSRRSPSPGP